MTLQRAGTWWVPDPNDEDEDRSEISIVVELLDDSILAVDQDRLLVAPIRIVEDSDGNPRDEIGVLNQFGASGLVLDLLEADPEPGDELIIQRTTDQPPRLSPA